jgi:hypothetical protein
MGPLKSVLQLASCEAPVNSADPLGKAKLDGMTPRAAAC